MSELRPLCRTKKIAGYALTVMVVLTAVGACLAGETTTKPAPIRFGSPSADGSGDITGLMWQMLSAALVVMVIGALALIVLKKLLPRIRCAPHKRIAVLETAYLGSRKAVHLLQVGSVKLLVASSSEGVVRLDDVTRAFPPEYADIAQRVGAETDADEQTDDPSEADSNAW